MENRFDQPCKDYQLANLADELFEKIKLSAADLLPFQVEQQLKQLWGRAEEREDAKEALTLYVLRRNFWTWMESSTQLTDFEKRYVMGHDMKVDGKSCRRDYNDETIPWEIGQKMDRAVLSKVLHRQSVTHTAENGKRVLGKPEQVEVEGWPASRREITGINCEYENWKAHQRPTAPTVRKKETRKES